MIDVILKRFETPDEIRHFEKGRFELVTLGATRCHMEHVGTVLSGHATATFDERPRCSPCSPRAPAPTAPRPLPLPISASTCARWRAICGDSKVKKQLFEAYVADSGIARAFEQASARR